ncbi:MAG: hypothetical protein QOG30_3355 [Acidimicrobiaceae bacterium]
MPETVPTRRLRVLVLAGPDLARTTGATGDALAAALHAAGRGECTVEVRLEPCPPTDRLAEHVGERTDLGDIDVLVLATSDALRTRSDGDLRTTFFDTVAALMPVVRAADIRVLLSNDSTVVPRDRVLPQDPFSLDIARLNLAALELSVATGLSVIDVDRLIAELGGGNHVGDALSYSATARAAIVAEIVRVIEDYGFFDDRPLLDQIGRVS